VSVKIRLQRVGTKKKPFYRVVVMDERKRRDGVEIENVGRYQPISEENQFVINEDRILHWLKKGAQPTETIAKMLRKSGVWQKYKSAQ